MGAHGALDSLLQHTCRDNLSDGLKPLDQAVRAEGRIRTAARPPTSESQTGRNSGGDSHKKSPDRGVGGKWRVDFERNARDRVLSDQDQPALAWDST